MPKKIFGAVKGTPQLTDKYDDAIIAALKSTAWPLDRVGIFHEVLRSFPRDEVKLSQQLPAILAALRNEGRIRKHIRSTDADPAYVIGREG